MTTRYDPRYEAPELRRAAPVEERKEAEPEERRESNNRPVAVAGLAVGLILWPFGARYSIDGLFWLANAVLAFLRIPVVFTTPPHWAFYCLLAPLPYLCSRVEWKPPIYKSKGRWRLAAANIVATWLAVAGYDYGTTYLGLSTPTGGAPIGAEIAASIMVAVALGAVLTFGPEWLIRTSWRELTKG